jgi:hypothetical protein
MTEEYLMKENAILLHSVHKPSKLSDVEESIPRRNNKPGPAADWTSASDYPESTAQVSRRKTPLEVFLTTKDREAGLWLQYGVKHEACRSQLQDYAHKEALAFAKENLHNPSLTQEELAPIYIRILDKIVRNYRQEKDERAQSSRQSPSTTGNLLPSSGEQQCELLNEICKLKEEVPPPSPEIIEIPVCERETISHQNLDTTPDHQPQENILSSWRSNVAEPIKCPKVESCQTQLSEGSYTPFASIISCSLRRSMSRPAFIGGKTNTCLEWRRRPSPYLVFESPVHATGKKPKPNRTELWFGCFAVAVALIYSSHWLWLQ